MKKVMTNGFCQLNEQEMMETEGGGWFSFWEGVGSSIYQATHNTWINDSINTAIDHTNLINSYGGSIS